MLVNSLISDSFLSKYKKLAKFLNGGVEPENISEYAQLRTLILENLQIEEENFKNLVGLEFYNCLKFARYGEYIFLKKYKNGYILNGIDDGLYYQVLGLTTPLEEIVHEYSVIETALIPYKNHLICDGLIVSSGVSIGKNMSKELRDGYWEAKRSGTLVCNV